MIVFLNGKFVEERAATVSVFDRSFQYGDGLFETIRIYNGKPFRWDQHMERLAAGAAFLGIQLAGSGISVPTDAADELRAAAERLMIENQIQDAVLRVTLSRGIGARGYSPKGAVCPTIVMSLHPATGFNRPASWKLVTSRYRLPVDDPLLRFKTANKLVQVVAKAEADAAAVNEALLLNTRREVCSATSANVFWIEGRQMFTPPVTAGALPGITRAIVIELAREQGLECVEKCTGSASLHEADGVFLTQSSRGIVGVIELDGKPLKRSPRPEGLRSAYEQLLLRETSE